MRTYIPRSVGWPDRALFLWLGLTLVLIASVALPARAQDGTNPLDTGSVIIQADNMAYDLENRIVTASDNVEIYYGERVLYADEVIFEETTGKVTAIGNVSVTEATGEVVFGDYVELTDEWQRGVVDGFRALIGQDVRLAANEGVRDGEDRYELSEAVYSPCPICSENENANPLWKFQARKVVYDRKRQTVFYRHAVLSIKGVPVFYAPFFFHGDPSVTRKSGFLFPTVGEFTDLGSFIEVPYYWAIAPHIDTTLTPVLFTEENPLLKGEFRMRTRTGQIFMEGAATFPDETADDFTTETEAEFRNYLFADGRFRLSPIWSWGFDTGVTSDDTFMRRYRINTSSEIENKVFLQGIDDWNFATVRGYYYNGLRATDDQGLIPVTLPDAKLEYYPDIDLFGGITSLDASFLGLTRTEGTDVSRLSASANWFRPLVTRFGHKFTAFGEVRGDVYYTNDLQEGPLVPTGDEDQETAGRFLPTAGLQWQYPLVRSGTRYSQIIEPIAQLVTSPSGGNPDEIPNEDSLSFEYDDANLFRPNKFPGIDLWENGTRLNVGIKATLIGFGGGENSILVGQTFRLNETDVFDEDTGLGDTESDYVGRIILTPFNNFTINHRFRLGRDDLDYKRSEVGVRLGEGRNFVNVDYLELSEELSARNLGKREELYATAGLGLTEDWAVAGGLRRNLETDEMVRTDAALIYSCPCAEFSINFTRRFTSDRDVRPDSSLFFRIKLRTLGAP